MKKYKIRRCLAGVLSGLMLLLPSCIKKEDEETYLFPSVTYSYQTQVDESVLTTGLNPTYLYLANKQNPVDKSYDPGTLVTLPSSITRKTEQLEERTAEALYAMLAEMRADGVTDIFVTSSYRTFARQQQLYNSYIEQEKKKGCSHEEAVRRAERYSAPPGYSEHQTGFVVDFMTSTMTDLDESFERTAAFAWLSENCYRFGFILRYPKSDDKIAITGYDYEPWHYRFVGREAATEIMKRGITLEEFLTLRTKIKDTV